MSHDEIQDDTTIPDDERLWRRVFSKAIHIDEETNEIRAQSGAFRDSRGPLSVDIASLTTKEKCLVKGPNMQLAEFRASVARDAGCKLRRDPLNDNRSHALIYGNSPNGSLTAAQAKIVAHHSRII